MTTHAMTHRNWSSRVLANPVGRMLVAALCCIAPLALTFIVAESLVPKTLRVAWPNLLAALMCALGYVLYVRRFEQRAVTELGAPGAAREWLIGAGLGALLCLATLAPLALLGFYSVQGFNAWTVVLMGVPEMALVSVFEEILVRGILFRIAEQAWGSRRALLISGAFFVLAHLPGDDINLMGVVATAVAATGFAAAYMLTRRLWLPIGMHFAWNLLFSAVFSVPVSGHEAKGWVQGTLSGPVWLSGGPYGVEASAMTVLVWALAAGALVWLATKRGQFLPGSKGNATQS
jgi:uncharacterized protein